VRWILAGFAVLVASLCLLCGEQRTAHVSRAPVEISERPAAETSPAPKADVEEPDSLAEVEETLEETPVDPIAAGDCSLFVSLASAGTGEPVRSKIKLYRLGVPGSEHWTAGDQLHTTVKVPRDGKWIHKLPEGRYRIHALAQRHPSQDPFHFSVRGATTKRSFELPMPRTFRSRLVVVNEHGAPIREAQKRRGFYSSHARTVEIPWVRERKLRDPDRYTLMIGGGIGGGTGGRRRWLAVTATDGAFDLGKFREDPRDEQHFYPTRFRILDRTEVRVRQAHEPGRDQTWMAFSVKPRSIEDTIFYPDGRLASRARVWIHSDAVIAPEPCPAEFWRTLKLSVRVSLEGYEEMRFTVSPAQPLKPRFLKRASGTSPN